MVISLVVLTRNFLKKLKSKAIHFFLEASVLYREKDIHLHIDRNICNFLYIYVRVGFYCKIYFLLCDIVRNI